MGPHLPFLQNRDNSIFLQRDGHFLSRKSLVEKNALRLNSITHQVRGTPAPRAALLKNDFKNPLIALRPSSLEAISLSLSLFFSLTSA